MKLLCIFLLLSLSFSPLSAQALSLAEGLKTVTESGRDVRIAQSDEEIARGSVSLARSPWLPSVDLYARETWLRYQPEAKFSGTNVATSQDKFATYGLKATQLLYDFGKTSAGIHSAQFGLKAREIETSRAKNQAALEFIMAYLDLLESEKLFQVALDEVTRYEAHKKDATTRYAAGVITKNEVLQADVMLSDSKQRFLTADNVRSLKASKLNSMLMRPLNDLVQVDEVQISLSAGITLEHAWTVAEAESADLRDMDARIAAKEEGVKMTQAEYLPTFYLSGGYEYLENKYMVHQDNWSLIAGVSVNLFSGGASSSKVGIARSELRSLTLNREKVLDNIRLTVKGAYLDLQSSTQKMEVSKTAVAQAEENLRLQKLRFKEGVGTTTDVLDAVTLMTTAASNSWKSLYGVRRAEAILLYGMGKDLATAYGN